jgi:hypothetical protein
MYARLTLSNDWPTTAASSGGFTRAWSGASMATSSEIVGYSSCGYAAELESTLRDYLKSYSRSIPQCALDDQMLIQALQIA